MNRFNKFIHCNNLIDIDCIRNHSRGMLNVKMNLLFMLDWIVLANHIWLTIYTNAILTNLHIFFIGQWSYLPIIYMLIILWRLTPDLNSKWNDFLIMISLILSRRYSQVLLGIHMRTNLQKPNYVKKQLRNGYMKSKLIWTSLFIWRLRS